MIKAIDSDIGNIKITKGQIKKHCTQFTRKEKEMLVQVVRSTNTNNLRYANHIHREFINDTLVKTIKNCTIDNIKDFSISTIHRDDLRVLIRSNYHDTVELDGKVQQCNLCFVLALNTNTIITTWYNSVNRKKDKVNMNRYTNFKIDLNTLKKILKKRVDKGDLI